MTQIAAASGRLFSLLLGCGNDHSRRVSLTEQNEWLGQLFKVDMNPDCGADLVWDLEKRPLPFADESCAEAHLYDVAEHLGRQGDWRGWFEECAEYWRILAPGGLLHFMVPVGADAFADPGHTRFFSTNHFWMLSQDWYAEQLAKGVRVSDYRWYWKHDFKVRALQYASAPEVGNHHIIAVLEKA